MNERPQSLPKCEHRRIDVSSCPDCRMRDKKIAEAVQPLADEFWENARTANRSIEHMLLRAYRMGMRHSEDS